VGSRVSAAGTWRHGVGWAQDR